VRPGWDDKVLADWNGMMITALARAGAVFGEATWLDAASEAFAFVLSNMTVDGRLAHSWRAGRARHPATLDDYAHMARAALALTEATSERGRIAVAEGWLAILDAHYWDQDAGGYFFTADDTADVILRNKTAADHATPAGNSAIIEALARLFHLTGKSAYRDRAEATYGAFAGEIGRNFFPLASFLNAGAFLEEALQVVIVGDASDSRAMLEAVRRHPAGRIVLAQIAPGESLPAGHPAAGKGQVDGRATAYVCSGMTCSLPILDPHGLDKALAHA